jgi:hypothetical protein
LIDLISVKWFPYSAFGWDAFVEEIVRQLQLVEASGIVGTAAMADTLRQVARKCPSIRRMILIGGSEEGFASIGDMFNDSGDLFDDNLDVRRAASALSFRKLIEFH